MNLRDLGNFRIERTENYPEAEDKSYAEMIRVRGSGPDIPCFEMPSHLYKFSDSELALYLKDHKNYWRPLGKLLKENVSVSDEEIILRFPVKMFSKVAEIVPFVRKRGQFTNRELARAVGSETQYKKNERHKIEQKEQKHVLTEPCQPITPDTWEVKG